MQQVQGAGITTEISADLRIDGKFFVHIETGPGRFDLHGTLLDFYRDAGGADRLALRGAED